MYVCIAVLQDAQFAEVVKQQSEPVVERFMSQQLGIIMWIYEAKTDKGIFTKDTAEAMKKAEMSIVGKPGFEDWCLRKYEDELDDENPNYECNKFDLSPIKFLFASSFDVVKAKKVISELSKPLVFEAYKKFGRCFEFPAPGGMPQSAWEKTCDETGSVAAADKEAARWVSTAISVIIAAWDGKGKNPVEDMTLLATFTAWMKLLPSRSMSVDFLLDKNFALNNTVNMFSRSILSFGGPLAGYNNTEDDEDKQDSKLKTWILDKIIDDVDATTKGDFSKSITVYYFMTAIIFDVFLKILINDAIKVILSIAFVFSYIWITVGSLFLAIVGMSEIVLSIPVAWFCSRVILQVQYFGGLNLLTIFIVCAIGADDIFVFMDAYVQSQFKGPTVVRDFPTRMTWVYRKSGLAMLITSTTTCAAFLCCLATPIPGTQAFGIFAALVILMDYFFVMTMFCTAVMVYHNRFEKPPLCGCTLPTPLGPCKCGCCIENCDCR